MAALTTIDCVIDAAGRRIARKTNGTLERAWLYQNGLEPVAELDASGAIAAVFVYGTKPHVPDLVIRGGVTYRVITDHLGSVRRLVNTSTGAVAQAFEYDAWGRITSSSCNGVATCEDLQPFRYAGGLYDRDTGLTRFGARDYDAETGRWTAKDPIGFGGGDSNVWAYVGGDPVNAVDPTGRLPWVVSGLVGGLGGAAVGAAIAAATGKSVGAGAMVGFATGFGAASGATLVGLAFSGAVGAEGVSLTGAAIGGFAGGASGNATGQVMASLYFHVDVDPRGIVIAGISGSLTGPPNAGLGNYCGSVHSAGGADLTKAELAVEMVGFFAGAVVDMLTTIFGPSDAAPPPNGGGQ